MPEEKGNLLRCFHPSVVTELFLDLGVSSLQGVVGAGNEGVVQMDEEGMPIVGQRPPGSS